MRKILLAACLSVLAISQVHANDTSATTGKPLTDQQQKMKDCSKENKGKKGADYKAAQKACLSKGGAAAPAAAAPAAAAPATAAAPAAKVDQKTKMKSCNADAKTKALKGDDRKAFMKTCLSAG